MIPVAVRTRLGRAVAGRAGRLLGARVIEQGAYGVVSLVLARWVGPDQFAAVGALLVFNSFAIVASDAGVGLAILSGEQGSVAPAAVRRARVLSAAVGVAVVAGSQLLDGDWRSAGVWAGLIWVLSAEAFIRKSALLRADRADRVAGLEIAGSLVFATVALAGGLHPSWAIGLVGAACAAKHAVELIGCGGWRVVLGQAGGEQSTSIWWSQVLAYAIANVDFVLIGTLVSATAFSIYSLGFRAASLITSQVGYAVVRVMLVDMAKADADEVPGLYQRWNRRMFAAGLAVAVVTIAGAPLLPLVLGRSWADTAWVVVLLSIATPWRLTLGLTGALFVTGGRAGRLVRWEVLRLTVTVVILAAGAAGGLWWFCAAAATATIAATVLMDAAARAEAGIVRNPILGWAAVPAVCVAVAAAGALS